MIARLSGQLVHRAGLRGILDVQGVGYEVFAPGRCLDDWLEKDVIVAWISTQVREDAFMLYGFSSEEERLAFEVLMGVKGVGPKASLAALDTLEVSAIAQAVEADDVSTLSQIPGVGKRTAQRLALELKGKLPSSFEPHAGGTTARPRKAEDPLQLALAQLDYGKAEIDRARATLQADGLGEGQPLESRLAAALRVLSGRL
jgi:Holliday junction DNA helicase RuvA